MISEYEALLLYFPRALASKKSEVVDVVMNDNNNDEDDMTAPAAVDTESKLNYAKKNRVWDLVMNEYFRWIDDLPVRSSRIQNLSQKGLQFRVYRNCF